MRVRQDTHVDDINNNEKHTLFIEGKDNSSIDCDVLRELLDNAIDIQSLGPSYHVKSVAEALYPSHPYYYFLVDRDDISDDVVEASWQNFPDPQQNNLIYWRRKEFENYFLIPDFICSSQFFTGTKEKYVETLERAAAKRVYHEAVKLVICQLRNNQNTSWIRVTNTLSGYETKDSALNTLLSLSAFTDRKDNITNSLNESNIISLYDEKIDLLLNGSSACKFGQGKWLEFMNGKILLKELVNSSFFKIKDTDGKPVQGSKKIKIILKDLVQSNKDNSNIPNDFKELQSLIQTRVNS